ncbi:hypothetical protein DVH24_036191 [Malus domestica]|uniref:Leucine-rich repeat-containing N-terminal plant-type domain-containing protein n=1 Tax=Malus domestica TaxID=3750 RepID=A0A498IF39_MALDO|nr:hypothetical protein DVH24_036191 [Malus domestica]
MVVDDCRDRLSELGSATTASLAGATMHCTTGCATGELGSATTASLASVTYLPVASALLIGGLTLTSVTLQQVLCMMSTCPESAAFPSPTLLGNESDRLALLDFKKRITEDPLSVMSSWNHSIHFCSWVGITCHRATQRVLILDLEDKQLHVGYGCD